MIKPRIKSQAPSKKIVYTCQNCGSEDVEVKAWWDPNKGKLSEIIEEDLDLGWCKYCDDNQEMNVHEVKT